MDFEVSACGCSEVVKAVLHVYDKTLIVKLSPNVTDVAELARAAYATGADSVSLIKTLLGMLVDAAQRMPVLSTMTADSVLSAINRLHRVCPGNRLSNKYSVIGLVGNLS